MRGTDLQRPGYRAAFLFFLCAIPAAAAVEPVIPGFADSLSALTIAPSVGPNGLSGFADGRGRFLGPVAIFPRNADIPFESLAEHTEAVRSFTGDGGDYAAIGAVPGEAVHVAPKAAVSETDHPVLILRPDGTHGVRVAAIEALRRVGKLLAAGDHGDADALMKRIMDGAAKSADLESEFAAMLTRSAGPLAADDPRRSAPFADRFALIKPGSILLGDASPREVALSRALYAQKWPTTRGEYRETMGRDPSSYEYGGEGMDHFPLTDITAYDGMLYANARSQAEGLALFYDFSDVAHFDDWSIKSAKIVETGSEGYRLSTDSEWNYLTRADMQSPYWFDADQVDVSAWYDGHSGGHPPMVATGNPNSLGLYDTAQNVFTRVSSIDSDGRLIILGAWPHYAGRLATFRFIDHPGKRYPHVGLRLVRSIR